MEFYQAGDCLSRLRLEPFINIMSPVRDLLIVKGLIQLRVLSDRLNRLRLESPMNFMSHVSISE